MMAVGKRGVDYIGVGVGAVILNNKNEILLLLRKKAPEKDHWTIPGGAVEWFETCEQAIERECREEVALDIKVERMLTVVNHIVETEQKHWVSVEFLVTPKNNKNPVMDQFESEKMKWFSIDNLPSNITQPTREAVDAYLLS